MELSVLHVTPIPHPFLTKLRTHVEEKAEKSYKEDVVDDYKKTVFQEQQGSYT